MFTCPLCSPGSSQTPEPSGWSGTLIFLVICLSRVLSCLSRRCRIPLFRHTRQKSGDICCGLAVRYVCGTYSDATLGGDLSHSFVAKQPWRVDGMLRGPNGSMWLTDKQTEPRLEEQAVMSEWSYRMSRNARLWKNIKTSNTHKQTGAGTHIAHVCAIHAPSILSLHY